MFGLFKSKPDGVKVIDKVWMATAAKLNACADMLQVNPDCLFITWFEETFRELKHALGLPNRSENLLLAADVNADLIENKMVIFAEHYPLARIEQELFSRLGLQEVPVLAALDEPFLEPFAGGGKTVELMRKLGMKENEAVGNSMVAKSIRNAQEKIGDSVIGDQKAASPQEWFLLNMK